MDNETIFMHEEKNTVADSSIATVTAVITQWTTDDAIINYFENSTHNNQSNINQTFISSANSTIQNFFSTISDWDIFDEIPWLIWIVVGAGTSLIIIVLISIIIYLVQKTKSSMRKSRRSSTSDQRIVDSSDNISEFMWPKWMFCCPKSIFDKQENLRMMRQNSASNLDPYRRPPLPPINRSNTTDDEFHNNLLLSQRLESMRTTESYLNALAGKAENLSVLTDVESGNSNKLFGINITGIRGIPVMPLENNRKRALPIPPSDCFNQL